VHIAPNGTAWLPVNQCNGHQGGVVSADGGLTWTEFAVPGAVSQTNGADPSIAVDADSTAYYCYVNNETVAAGLPPEGHVHVKVSRDGGASWINDVDLGASHGIKNAVHTEAVGGSSGRAACGFIGTNVAGDYQAKGFPGSWYAFIATTYDGGAHWVTVNATPNDPVQRLAGVWQQGGSQTQRNLLDFNEITLDDQGRVLYGYSDGCVSPGCVAGSAANDFVAHMRVARQIGGRPLLASKDFPEPSAPRASCLAGQRDPSASHLSWIAPDNRGASISAYQVLRGTSPGSETLVGQAGAGATSFNDATADPAVPTYYYVVKAVNASGVGVASNRVALTAVVPPPAENVCQQPGLTKLTDASGDTSALLVVNVSTPAPAGSDLKALGLVQPYTTDGTVKLSFTLSTDAGRSPQPPGTAWYVAMKIPDPAPATTFHYRAVHMSWNGTTPVFESYTPGAANNGAVDGRFVTSGTTKPADASSSYSAPFDKATIVVKASDLGLAPGDTIAGFVAGVSQTAGGVLTGLYDAMPNSLAFTGSYTVRANRLCAPQTPPVAVLHATPNVGCAPLVVTLDGLQSYDADQDAITSYAFDFGDGAQQTTAAASTTHTYAAGSFTAALAVADERGGVSSNTAQAQVSVAAPPPTPVIDAPRTAKQRQSGLVASVAAHAGSQYAWSIQNGTITAGQGTSRITFTAGSKGDLTLSVTEVSGQGCLSTTGRATVVVGNGK
jgi:PKD repeat protein